MSHIEKELHAGGGPLMLSINLHQPSVRQKSVWTNEQRHTAPGVNPEEFHVVVIM